MRTLCAMQELVALNNFNGAMEVISGLNSAPVRKLQMTWRVRRCEPAVRGPACAFIRPKLDALT